MVKTLPRLQCNKGQMEKAKLNSRRALLEMLPVTRLGCTELALDSLPDSASWFINFS
jgi:hypothetical protein